MSDFYAAAKVADDIFQSLTGRDFVEKRLISFAMESRPGPSQIMSLTWTRAEEDWDLKVRMSQQ